MNGVLDWLGVQAHVMASVLGAVMTDQPAPARQVIIYAAVLALLFVLVPKIVKLVTR